jgi:hypothetical protein
MSNNPEDVVSKSGVEVRKFLSPVIRKFAPLSGHYKLVVDGKAEIPKGVPIIYAPTHGFKDDLLYTIVLINKPAYVLFGSLPQFFNSTDGITAWLNGVILVDRTNKENRNASIPKMERVIDLGSDLIIFPEGVWNKRPDLLMLDLFPGIYRVAKSKNAIIMPIATHLESDICYATMGEAFDITKFNEEKGLIELRDILATLKWNLIEKYSYASHLTLLDGKTSEEANRLRIEERISQVKFYDRKVENNAEYKKPGKINEEEVYSSLYDIDIHDKSIDSVLILTKINKSRQY